VADVEAAVRLGRETGDDLAAVLACLPVVLDYVPNKVPGGGIVW